MLRKVEGKGQVLDDATVDDLQTSFIRSHGELVAML
jgi:hypothetical protein